MSHKSDFLKTLDERGFIHQCSDFEGLDALAARGEAVGYIGFDCTAVSLHIGSLIQIMMLHWLQATGNKPIALMGGGTTRVGDPSGKDESRKLLSIEEIEANKEGIGQVFSRFLRFGEGKSDAVMLDNADWLTKLNYIEFLRDVGRHFSVNRMLSMDSVKLRLERDQEMSFIEFNYMCLQSYDFVELARRRGLQSADGRLGSVGQHHHRCRSRTAHGHASALCAHDAAPHHRLGRQDGQDRGRRRVAQCRPLQPL